MKKNKLKFLIILPVLLLLTGCATQLKTDDNKLVKNEITGQTLTKNVLCKPINHDVIAKYKEVYESTKNSLTEKLAKNEITQKEYDKKIDGLIDVDELQNCKEFSVTKGEYEGIWNTLFVKPLAWIIIKVGDIVGNYGLAVIIITILIRLCLYPVTKKTAMQSELMKDVKPELDKIEKKYKDKTDQQSMMAKSQETMMIYKKYGVNPVSGCIFAFLQIPLFFAFYESLMRLPLIFEGNFLGIDLGTTAGTAIMSGKYYYIIIVLLVVLTTYFSMKLNKTASMDSEQAKTMGMMTNIMIVMISIASFTISTGITLYWISNSAFTIVQNLLVKGRKKDVKVI